ncbi:polyamine-transporting ATPase 13A3-like isoform X2 [Ostrea edulis]|uniref:polyamine-transporting ATPase 13A3-like isoform X2 n=1 Tax=Ostrea edulis TaxID=37623 RepID=UPI0024AF7C54|nr:polyamine-transporting ATPase 13A3-like isoform X2 [Ostrea edulis]
MDEREWGDSNQVKMEMNSGLTFLNKDTDDQMVISGYRVNKVRRWMVYVGYLLTGGILPLVLYWCPHWYIKCTHTVTQLSEATKVVLKDQYEQWFVAEVVLVTKDGTRVKIIRPTPAFSFSKRRRKATADILLTGHDENLMRYFVVKKVKYCWNNESQEFEKLKGLENNMTCSQLHALQGLSATEQCRRRITYGANSIAVHVKPVVHLLFKEILSPFYVFQAFSASVWFSDEYEIYASCIVFLSTLSIIVSIYQTRKMQRALKNTIQSSTVVSVCRENNEFVDIHSDDLVPGDIIEIPRRGCNMQCDAVLLTGNCIVNESMLTGESVPITKTPLPNPGGHEEEDSDVKFSMKEHSKHVLFCGTQVIQTRFYGNQKVKALVIRTGFSTSKGDLVRSIMYPKPADFKFERDTYIFVGVLAIIAGFGFIYSIVLEVRNGEDTSDIILHALDIITIAVPPALPAALTVGIVFAQQRLKNLKIYCISPRCINVCGGINAVCFDKTGTLTEDGLMMQGVVPANDSSFEDEVLDPSFLKANPLLVGMATCHSLTIIEGSITGDPLDVIMFNSIGWVLEEPGEEESRFDMMVPTVVYPSTSPLKFKDDLQYGVIRQFTFSSALQRMSVVARNLNGQSFELYTKGAPEMIASLCKQETVPPDFHEKLMSYTQHGYRVIAMAWKELPSKINYVKVQRIQREQVEKDLIFLGLIVMENKLKPETTPVINELREANIRCIMVTGDNVLTAVSVARECRMVDTADQIIVVEAAVSKDSKPMLNFVYADDKTKPVEEVKSGESGSLIQIEELDQVFHFAVEGRSWAVLQKHYPEILPKIAVKGTVFARMSPEQKGQLVELLQELGYYVGMCGDGANDCGALKMAHAGISLSEAEASVASPFTSKVPNVKCVPNVIRQGRAALVTSYGIFKYMACYSLTQFVSVSILYYISASLTDPEFLYIDLFLLSTLSITFGRTDPYPELAKEPPPISLTSIFPIMSLVLQMLIQTAAQTFCFLHIKSQPWFEPFVENPDDNYWSYENTAVFSMSAYQYIILAITFSKGFPYRRNMFTNYWFLVNVVVCVLVTLWVTIYPEPKGFQEVMELRSPESISYRLLYVGIAAANFLLSVLIETYFLDNPYLRNRWSRFVDRCLRHTEVKYKTIEREIIEAPDWPPIDKTAEGVANGYMRLDSMNSIQGVNIYHPSDSESDIKSLTSVSSQKVATNTHRNCVDKSAFNQGSLPCIVQNSKDTTSLRQTRKSRTLSESAVDNAEGTTNDDILLSDEITSLAHARSRDKVSNSSSAIPLIDPPPGRKKTFGSQEDTKIC